MSLHQNHGGLKQDPRLRGDDGGIAGMTEDRGDDGGIAGITAECKGRRCDGERAYLFIRTNNSAPKALVAIRRPSDGLASI